VVLAGKGLIMIRYNSNVKGGTYTSGQTYSLVPIVRHQVVPGQTINLDAQVSLKTAALTQNVSTPSIMSVWFFYVPHRLTWEVWPAYLSQEEGAPAFPTTTTASDTFFDKTFAAASGVSPLYRRAYKMVYNEFFGTETLETSGVKQAWYSDITADSQVNQYGLRNPQQFASKLIATDTSVDPEFSVTASSIPLNEFYRQLMNARSTQRSQMTGNKYVDTLARMGVDASWMIAERPEFLGTKSKMVAPQLTGNTTSTDSAFETARWQCGLEVSLKNKHFAEHGYIVGVAGIRPLVIDSGVTASDAYVGVFDGYGDFYKADNLQSRDKVSEQMILSSGTDSAFTDRFAYLRSGQWQTGYITANPWYAQSTNTTLAQAIYPVPENIPFSDELGDVSVDTKAQAAFTTSYSITGKTPVKLSVA
jgi:hypothetical protein